MNRVTVNAVFEPRPS